MKREPHRVLGRILTCSPLCMLMLLNVLGGARALAGTPAHWVTNLVAAQGLACVGVGVLQASHDGWDGQAPVDPYWFSYPGLDLLLYREHSPAWGGPTGFYPGDFESPLPAGASKTWWDFYLWAHNYTPSPLNQIQVRNVFEDDYDSPPTGYIGHIVIDQIPAGVSWTGPMDYWFDMTTFNTFLMPIAQVTDPLQGTRFHLTVYTPEPSSLLVLVAGIGGMVLHLARRRRR